MTNVGMGLPVTASWVGTDESVSCHEKHIEEPFFPPPLLEEELDPSADGRAAAPPSTPSSEE
jgi:hypothetical protein